MSSIATTNLYRSLTAISEQNSALLAKMGFAEDDPHAHAQFAQQVRQFIAEVASSGAVLADYYDRTAAQKFADYWSHYLYQKKFVTTISPVQLALYDPHAVSEWAELADEDFPYADLAPDSIAATTKLLPSRQAVVEKCLSELEQCSVALLLGSPHSGRSVVLRAGLEPRLRDPNNTLGVRDVRVISFADSPLACLRTLGATAAPVAVAGSAANAADGPANWEKWRSGSDLVLIVDTFEDLFAPTVSEVDRVEVLSQLEAWVRDDSRRNRLILLATNAVRDELRKIPFLHPRLDHVVSLSAVDSRELHELVRTPAERIGLIFAEGLVEELVSLAVGDPAALPWLYLALRRLWGRRKQNVIDWQTYREIGGEQFLPKELDRVIADATQKGVSRKLVRALLLQLVTAGTAPGSFDCPLMPVARLVEALERPFPGSESQVRGLVEQFAATGFLAVSRPNGDDSPSISVTHPGLIYAWPVLLRWLEETARDQQDWLQLYAAAAAWSKYSRDTSLLWSDSGTIAIGDKTIERALASGIVTERHGEFILANEFLRASQEYLERANRRRVRLLRSLAAAGFGGAVVCAIFAIVAHLASLRATQSANRLLVTQGDHAVDVADNTASLVWLSSAISNERSRSRIVNEPLKRQWTALRHQVARIEFFATATSVAGGAANRKDHGIVTDPDGRWLIMPDEGGIRLRRAVRTEEHWPLKLPERLAGDRNCEFCSTQTRFSGNGRWLATVVRCAAPIGQSLVVWRIPRELPPSGTPLEGHELTMPTSSSDADDKSLPLLIAMAADSSAQRPPIDSDDDSPSAAPVPTLVATQGRRMSIWRLSTSRATHWHGQAMSSSKHPLGVATAVAASWNIGVTRAETDVAGASVMLSERLCVYVSFKLKPTTSGAASSSFAGSPGRDAANSGATLCWEFSSSMGPKAGGAELPLVAEISHGPTIDAIQTSPFDGRLVALLNGQRQECLVWLRGSGSLKPDPQLFRVSTRTRAAAFSPDGRLFATGSQDAVVLWRVNSLPESREPRLQYVRRMEHDSDVFSLGFSPDGQLLASGSRDKTVRVWHVPTGALLLPPVTHANTVSRVAFNRDGTHVTTIDGQRSVRRFAVGSSNPAPRPIAMSGVGSLLTALDGQGRYLIVQAATPVASKSTATNSRPELYDVQAERIEAPVILSRRGEGGATSASAEQTYPPSCAAFSSNGRTLAIGYLADGLLEWRTIESQTFSEATSELQRLPRPPLDSSTMTAGAMLALSKNGAYAAVIVQGSEVGYACVCRRPTNDESAQPAATPQWFPVWRDAASSGAPADASLHAERINSVAISNDGRLMSTASSDDRIRVWPLGSDWQARMSSQIKSVENRKSDGHSADATVVQFVLPRLPTLAESDVNSYSITSAGADGAVIVWNFAPHSTDGVDEDYRLVRQHRIESPGNLRCFDLSANGDWLLVGALEGHLSVWHLDPPVRRARFQHAGQVLSAAFDPADNRIVSVCRPADPLAGDGGAATKATADQIWVYRWNLRPTEADDETLVDEAKFLAAREYSSVSSSLHPIGDVGLAALYGRGAPDSPLFAQESSSTSDEQPFEVAWAAHSAWNQWFAARWHAARRCRDSGDRTHFATMLVEATARFASGPRRPDLEERECMHVVALASQFLDSLAPDDPRRYGLLRHRADAYRRLSVPQLAIADYQVLASWKDDGMITLADRALTLFLLAESHAEAARAYARSHDTGNEDACLNRALQSFTLCRDIYRMLPAYELELADAWYHVALLTYRDSVVKEIVLTDDRYQRECAAMWVHFRGTKSPLVANLLAWTCCLSSRSGVSLTDLQGVVDATSGKELEYYQEYVKGALLFRRSQQPPGTATSQTPLELSNAARDTVDQARAKSRSESSPSVLSVVQNRFDAEVAAGTPYDWILLSLIYDALADLDGGNAAHRSSSDQWYSNFKSWRAKHESAARVQWDQLIEWEILSRERNHTSP